VNTLQIQTHIMRIFSELKKALLPVSIEPLYTCRTAHIFALVANTKMCSIFLEQIRFFFFFERSIKFLGSGLKFRVGQVSGNTTFFLYGLMYISSRSELYLHKFITWASSLCVTVHGVNLSQIFV
jgi:hypothetical protein